MFGIKTIATGLVAGAILGGGGALALGGGALALWNKAPWSAASRLKKAEADLTQVRAALTAEKQISKDRLEAINGRDRQAVEIAKADAGDVTETAAAWSAQCSAAFNAGVSAGRRICNASSPPTPPGQPVAGGVQPSFRSEFQAERYTPSSDRLPGPG